MFKKLAGFILGGCAAAVGLIGRLLTKAQRISILAERGSQAYHGQLTAFTVVLLVGAGVLGLSAAWFVFLKLKERKIAKQQTVLALEAELPKATLSFETGRLNEEELRAYLIEQLASAEPEIAIHLEFYQQQMDRMNMYQARLHKTLSLNGVRDLQETEVLLDKLEQSLFGNLRRAFNWINMRGSSPEEKKKLDDNLKAVAAENDQLLSKAKELCSVLTEYINNQSGGQFSAVVFDNFIKTMQEQLEEV